ELRNTLAHGGAMTPAMARYLLHGDASGQGFPRTPSDPAEGEEEDSPDAPAGSPRAEAPFRGWEPVLSEAVRGLADLLEGSRLCLFDGETARDLAGAEPSGDVLPLSADLLLALRRSELDGHVLLVRDGRWLDLWPLCDQGRARLTSLRGPVESDDD